MFSFFIQFLPPISNRFQISCFFFSNSILYPIIIIMCVRAGSFSCISHELLIYQSLKCRSKMDRAPLPSPPNTKQSPFPIQFPICKSDNLFNLFFRVVWVTAVHRTRFPLKLLMDSNRIEITKRVKEKYLCSGLL